MVRFENVQTASPLSHPTDSQQPRHVPAQPTKKAVRFKDSMTSIEGKNKKETSSSPFAHSSTYVKYGASLALGVVPYIASFLGIGVIQAASRASLWIERNSKGMENNLSQYVTGFSRILLGVPVFVAGVLCFGGSKLFARTQQFVWGQKLIENPIEEQTHTRLAKYGLKGELAKDFQALISAFFDPAFLTTKVSGEKKLKRWTTFNPANASAA